MKLFAILTACLMSSAGGAYFLQSENKCGSNTTAQAPNCCEKIKNLSCCEVPCAGCANGCENCCDVCEDCCGAAKQKVSAKPTTTAANDCCYPGSPCCYPGAPCCEENLSCCVSKTCCGEAKTSALTSISAAVKKTKRTCCGAGSCEK